MILTLGYYVAIALTIWFILFSEAGARSRVIVFLLAAASFLLRYTNYAMAGFFLQIALAIFVALYLKVQTG